MVAGRGALAEQPSVAGKGIVSTQALIVRLARRLRLRGRLIVIAQALLVGTGAALILVTLGAPISLWAILALGGAATTLVWRWRRSADTFVTARVVTHRLDDAFPQLEDSTGLLLRPGAELRPLERLQLELVAGRLSDLPLDKLRAVLARTSPAALLPAAGFAALAALFAFPGTDDSGHAPVVPGPDSLVHDLPGIVLTDATLLVRPPGYTGVAEYRASAEAAIPEASGVVWRLRYEGDPEMVSIVFDDESVMPLHEESDGVWVSGNWTARPALYRIESVPGAEPDPGLRRISVTPDEAPQLSWVQPQTSVVEVANLPAREPGLELRASDDYGVDRVVALLTLARGSGENVRFREQSLDMQRVSGDKRDSRFAQALDLTALGMEPGDELFVTAIAHDNREPESNGTRSATLIFRWTGEEAVAVAMEGGIALDVLPEYFRSQRQIIIDTEKLIADTDRLSRRDYANRAQSLAQDQKLLRLRYGQFLGEELVRDIGPGIDPEHDDGDHGDDQDHGEPAAENAANIDPTEYFVHSHNVAEQSTLFDDDTKTLLKQALANMWDAELNLRLAEPHAALPYENAALGFLKEVQQKSRIYLRRAGFAPPPVDEERRLAGELDDLRRRIRRDLETVSDGGQWQRLLAAHGDADETRAWFAGGDSDRFFAWISNDQVGDELRLTTLEILDSLRVDPECVPCRKRLHGLVLGQLPRRLPLPLPRVEDGRGIEAAFRDALREAPP